MKCGCLFMCGPWAITTNISLNGGGKFSQSRGTGARQQDGVYLCHF